MAGKELVLKLTWENEKEFELEAKRDAGAWLTVIKMEENGHISDLWKDAESICKTFIEKELAIIGAEMKA